MSVECGVETHIWHGEACCPTTILACTKESAHRGMHAASFEEVGSEATILVKWGRE